MADKVTFTKRIKKLIPIFRIPKDSWESLKLKKDEFVDITIKKHQKR